MLNVLCSDMHDEAVNEGTWSTQPKADSAHGQLKILLLVPVSNTPIGYYLKVTKSQISPANLILCWGVSCLNTGV